MNIDHLLGMTLESCQIPDIEEVPWTPERTDKWQLENRLLRIARGDFSRSDTPVNVPFVWKD